MITNSLLDSYVLALGKFQLPRLFKAGAIVNGTTPPQLHMALIPRSEQTV
jgi:hypothetical protein